MPNRKPAVLLALLVSLSACAKDYRLAPPSDSEHITVTVKVPEQLMAETMNVMYRSPICKRITRGASGQRIELDGYHGIDVQPQREGQSDLYSVKLPVDGGGACQWRLSNVIFGVAYSDPARFGEGVTYGAGGGIVVKFDHNRAPIGSGFPIAVDGDLKIEKDYYPWLHEKFIGGYKKDASLAGEGGIYVVYQALQARQVYFEPVLHSDFLVTSKGTKVHKLGDFIKFTYPDGSEQSDSSNKPNFRKLQLLRLSAEGKE